jgi:ABC-type transport system involved in multi-copper enzyme maturation permease subunit
MRAVALLAANFLRDQRLIIVLITVWILTFTIIFALTQESAASDLEAFYRQELIYGVAIGMFSGAAIVHNERRSRKILAVLSKGISRAQYLAGALVAMAALTLFYYVLVAATNQWLIARFSFQGDAIAPAVLGWLAAIAATAVALAFGTFLHPLFSVAATGLVVSLGMVIPHSMFPVSMFIRGATRATYAYGLPLWGGGAFLAAIAIETAIAFAIAVLMFRKRDVTAAVE